MKITYLYQYFGTPNGSWSTRVYEMTKRWVAEGNNITVITAPYEKSDIVSNKMISYQEVDGIKLVVLNFADSNQYPIWKRVYKALLFSILASYYTLKIKSDIIIASSGPITIGIPGLIGKWIKNTPLVFEVRDLWPDGGIEMGLIKSKAIKKISKWFERLCYKNASLIIPCSIGMENAILKTSPQSTTLTIPNGSDIELFTNNDIIQLSEMPIDYFSKIPLFIYAGSIGKMDACEEIITACNLLSKDLNYQILFLGKGSEEFELKRKVKESGLSQKIYFGGLVPKLEVVQWYKKAIASFVLFKNYPVLHTSSPNKMFDSFAAGVPIIQNTHGWIKELIQTERCGISYTSGSASELAEAIKLLLNNEELRKELSLNALNTAKSQFNRDLLAEKYLSALKNSIIS